MFVARTSRLLIFAYIKSSSCSCGSASGIKLEEHVDSLSWTYKDKTGGMLAVNPCSLVEKNIVSVL